MILTALLLFSSSFFTLILLGSAILFGLFLEKKLHKEYEKKHNDFFELSSPEQNTAYYNLCLVELLDDFKSYDSKIFKEVEELFAENPEEFYPSVEYFETLIEYLPEKKISKYADYSTEQLKTKLLTKVNKKMAKHFNKFESDYDSLMQLNGKKYLVNEQSVFNLKKSISTAI